MPYPQRTWRQAPVRVRGVAEVLAVHDQHDETDQHDASAHHGQPERFDEAFWNERYRSAAALWSGDPNRYLVGEASGLRPGAALDVGWREGADALWLAGHVGPADRDAPTADARAVLYRPGHRRAARPRDWQVITDLAPQRSAPDPDRRPVMIRDTVFRARRGG